MMKRTKLLAAFLVGALIAVGFIALRDPVAEARPSVTVYKSPTCGCCSKWVEYLEENGYDVDTVDLNDVATVKSRYGVPEDLASCHTALVNGYVVEGHVPVEEINRMLDDDADVAGIAVPGMPMGSPGMEGHRVDSYDILAFQKDGSRAVFASR